MNIDGMGEILRKNMLESIALRKAVRLEVFIRSLGISNVGGNIAEVLAKHFNSLEEMMKASSEEFNSIFEIGPIIANSLVQFFHDKESQTSMKRLLDSGFQILESEYKISNNLSLNNENFVFTGTLEHLSREEAQKLVKQYGAKASGSVSKMTTCVVYGANAGSKLKKADELGIKKITETEFLEWMNRLKINEV